MDLRSRLNAALKDAMRAKEADRLSTLRLINAAIKDRDIAARGDGEDAGVSDDEVLAILGKMVKQRQESARAYEEGGRLELAEKELAEIVVIEEFLPRQLDAAEVRAGGRPTPSPRPAPSRSATWARSWPCSRAAIPARWISARSGRWSRASWAEGPVRRPQPPRWVATPKASTSVPATMLAAPTNTTTGLSPK